MIAKLPKAVPEVPVRDVGKAAAYYVMALGFRLDWSDEESGVGGISQGDCRMFLANAEFRKESGSVAPVVVWLNLNSKEEVDELYGRWKKAGARILSEPEDKPWNLREFTAADLDGNRLRVFYDFAWEKRAAAV